MNEYKEKFERMRVAGKLASRTLDMLIDFIKPGISTDKIDQLAYDFIRDNGGYSAPQFYRGFKKSLCTSLNHVVCHGIPSDRILDEGDRQVRYRPEWWTALDNLDDENLKRLWRKKGTMKLSKQFMKKREEKTQLKMVVNNE